MSLMGGHEGGFSTPNQGLSPLTARATGKPTKSGGSARRQRRDLNPTSSRGPGSQESYFGHANCPAGATRVYRPGSRQKGWQLQFRPRQPIGVPSPPLPSPGRSRKSLLCKASLAEAHGPEAPRRIRQSLGNPGAGRRHLLQPLLYIHRLGHKLPGGHSRRTPPSNGNGIKPPTSASTPTSSTTASNSSPTPTERISPTSSCRQPVRSSSAAISTAATAARSPGPSRITAV